MRELRQQASKYLRAVEAGETLEVTDRGRPVALLVPVPNSGPMERLAAAGRLSIATSDLMDLGAPLAPLASIPLPTETLAVGRADER